MKGQRGSLETRFVKYPEHSADADPSKDGKQTAHVSETNDEDEP